MQETGLLGIKKVVTVGCDDRIFKKQLSYLGIVAGGGFEPPTFGL